MADQPAGDRVRGRYRLVAEFKHAAYLVQHRRRHNEVAVQRWFQLRVIRGVALRQVQAGARHRQRVFEQTTGEYVKAIARRRQALQRGGVFVEQGHNQTAQRFVGNVVGRQLLQLREHRRRILARCLDQPSGVETVCPVGVGHETDVMQLDELRAVALVLAVAGAELVELAGLPLALAGDEPRTVGPGHERSGPEIVAEPAGEERFAVTGRTARLFRQQGEKVSQLTGSQVGEVHDDRFGACHPDKIPDVGPVCCKKKSSFVDDLRTPSPPGNVCEWDRFLVPPAFLPAGMPALPRTAGIPAGKNAGGTSNPSLLPTPLAVWLRNRHDER